MTSDETNVMTASAPSPATGEIVVGLDDSVTGAAALRWAAEQSRSTGLPLRVVHAWELTGFEHPVASPEFANAASADARARATRLVLDTLGDAAAQVRWSLDVVEGPPGPVLVARSHGALLLAVGTRQHDGPRPATLGSVSHHCLAHADVPLVAVPARSEARERSPVGGGR